MKSRSSRKILSITHSKCLQTETEELLTFKPFPPIENVVTGKLLPRFENDGNNNKADDDNNRRNDDHEAVAEDEVMHDHNFMEPEQEKAFLELFTNLLFLV